MATLSLDKLQSIGALGQLAIVGGVASLLWLLYGVCTGGHLEQM